MKQKYMVIRLQPKSPYYRTVKKNLTMRQAQELSNLKDGYQYTEQPMKNKLRKIS